MNFFRKKQDKPETENLSVTPSEPVTESDESPKKAESVRRLNSPRQMNEMQVQRTKETRRLAETKLNNLEESLRRLQKQQEWLRRYNELKMALMQEKDRLDQLNKQQASMADEMRQLTRFETFESIHGTFQRTAVLERLTSQNKRNVSALAQENEKAQHAYDEQEKRQRKLREQRKVTESKMMGIMDNIFEGFRLNGSTESKQQELAFLQKLYNKMKLQLESIESNIREVEEEITLLEQELEHHRAGRQSMEMHEQMLLHGEAMLLRLDLLQEIANRIDGLRAQLKEATIRQNNHNDQLEKAFSQYQDIMSETETLEDELRTHRASIQGQESFKLQERAMRLKSDKQMLASAQSLWTRISTGYQVIEEKTRLINELRLRIDHTEENVQQMETESGRATRLAREKEYTYLLSKGQNIIQLRADLKEGMNCAVCGATHHPYHSDTMLEQSKLIGEFKTDYELLATEARSKQQQLTDMKMELAELKGRRMAEEAALNSVRQRQSEDVKEWRIFTSLDATFKDCSASTNLDARTAMLRQLIENTTRDAETAQKELDAFSFHQDRITELSEKLQVLEQKKADLSPRLNEINTACQVMTGQVDRLQTALEKENRLYSTVYERIGKTITIKDWLNTWKQSPEGLKDHIQKLMTAWDRVNEKINHGQRELEVEKTRVEGLKNLLAAYQTGIADICNHIERCNTDIEENAKNYEQALGKTDAKTIFLDSYAVVETARKAEEDENEATRKIMHEIDRIQGRNDFYVQAGNEMGTALSEERSKLDMWMHAYNAQNPPVQYAELESVLDGSIDWNMIRGRVRSVQMEKALCQARVDDLSGQIISLQAEGGYGNVNEEEMQQSLVSQQESLEHKRKEIIMQIARLTIALEEHEKAVNAANNSASVQDLTPSGELV